MPWSSLTSLGIAGSALNASTAALSSLTVPANALIVVGIGDSSTALGSLTDSAGQTYTKITSAANNGSTVNGNGAVYFTVNGKNTVTSITYTMGTTKKNAVIAGLSAIAAAPASDAAVTASATGSSASPSVTSGTPGQSGTLLVGWASIFTTATFTFTEDTTHTWTATGGLASLWVNNNSGNQSGGGGGNQIAAASKIFNPTFSQSGPWAAFVVGFKDTFTFFDMPPPIVPLSRIEMIGY